ncbi:MAG: DUF488 domain-containing protein [Rhodanobacter sp.]
MTKRKTTAVDNKGVSTIWTIGHSTRTFDEFLSLLTEYGIQAIADVRSFPGSRRYPYFGREALAETLPSNGIAYHWFQHLGGRRRVNKDSPNTTWRNASFRSYADYMTTPGFAAGLDELLSYASAQRTAYMCAEAVWWRCHRSMISDALKLRGIEVIHIIDAKHHSEHPYTEPAHVMDGQLTYLEGVGEPLRKEKLGAADA